MWPGKTCLLRFASRTCEHRRSLTLRCCKFSGNSGLAICCGQVASHRVEDQSDLLPQARE